MHAGEHSSAILLVDDDESIRKLVREYLERAGYSVITASDGALGLALFEQNRGKIALLLTDVAMPNMDGVDLADRVLELERTLPILFMSAAANADRGNGCIAKPFRGSELLARVTAALHCGPLSS